VIEESERNLFSREENEYKMSVLQKENRVGPLSYEWLVGVPTNTECDDAVDYLNGLFYGEPRY